MRRSVSVVMSLGALAPLMAACVHPGQYRKDLAETRSEISQEKQDRTAADSSLRGDINSVKSDVQGLRSDLQGLRTEFGAKIAAVEQGIQFDFPVNFAFNDAAVRDDDRPALDRFADVVKKYYGGSKVTIEGFADPKGSQKFNVGLSQRRADAVREYLSGKGLDAAELKTVGYGKTRLVNPGASKDDPGAEQNRRVVFVIETRPENAPQPATKTTASAGEVAGR
jgi:peptidoglycan-associated lipoprotein